MYDKEIKFSDRTQCIAPRLLWKCVHFASYFVRHLWFFLFCSFIPSDFFFQFFTLYLLLLPCSPLFSPKNEMHFPSKAAVMYLAVVTIQSHWWNLELWAVHPFFFFKPPDSLQTSDSLFSWPVCMDICFANRAISKLLVILI